MKFSQHIVVNVADEAALFDLIDESTQEAAPPGLLGMRVLKFRDNPGRYVIQADFDSWESAEQSNERPDTQAWAERLAAVIDGDPKYENLDVVREMAP
jgi:quinol monooxygenase YgiN